MNEIERIIHSGFLPQEYFEEEIICDFHVSTERKQLWGVMLEMIDKFDIVCKKYKLKYYLFGGSLLGAIRHKGFIPWDDDFDVLMPRADYEKFVLLQEEFKDPLFLQTPYTDPEYAYTFAKIRNSNTSGVVQMFKHTHFNHGIWISAFPLDYCDNIEDGKERYDKIKKLSMDNSTFMRRNNPDLDKKNKIRVNKYCGDHIRDYEEIQRLASYCRNPYSKNLVLAVFTGCPYENCIYDAADFSSSTLVPFENLLLPAPVGYDHILKQFYGDYMSFPPVEERGKHHSDTVFNAIIPYKAYLENEGII